ncbi:MAG: Gfo/Idh/MocA family oxidoreductase [Caldilinea sp.]|uniref:Gfo/Idh/MocA family protein n=1 Tax=Caldilinea sp. TaxID=2293560 RepID=UPI002C105036|nr:Gfo/Idh/MocA family oxidoreductase [Anaerolineales bacterium]HQY94683.1 Gfo/Idh/MocA family oxidoreductase [Caldilinea sp.]HRA67371.1 Gfo/Idh/MocA family oxidoreductase [Caldilinea sp.]
MSNAERIRVGVIGVGQIGKRHVETYAAMPNVEIVAIADVNDAEAERVAARHGIPNRYAKVQDLLARDDIQAVDVCLHNNYHMPATVAALEAGKDVFCEKPMAGAYVDAVKMWEAAQATGRKLAIQFVTMFSNETKAARYLIEAGHVGKLYHVRSVGHRRRGRPFVDGYGSPTFVQKEHSAGGALYDMGVYHIATALWLIGNPPVTRITGRTYQEIDMDARRREISGYNVEELGVGFIHFATGLTLDIVESWAVHMDNLGSSVILGSQGGVKLDPFGYFFNLGHLDLNASANMEAFNWRLHNVAEDGDAYDGPQQHWIAALQGRVPLIPSAACALNTMLISEGIYLSERLGREVTAEDVLAHSISTARPV